MTDSPGKTGQVWLQQLLQLCGVPIAVHEGIPANAADRLQAFGGHWLTLDTEDLSATQVDILLGEKGQVLDAMQYLLNATLHLTEESQEVYTVEMEEQRENRYLELLDIAEQVVKEVRDTGAEVEMEPLPPAERRLIHTLLANTADLETFSRGQEPQRCLVVCPAGEKTVIADP